MGIKEIRELSGALNAVEHSEPADAGGFVRVQRSTVVEAGDALNYAADEIERLTGVNGRAADQLRVFCALEAEIAAMLPRGGGTTPERVRTEIERLTAENARLMKLAPAPAPRCGVSCAACSKCIACGYCRCPAAPPHPHDKPAAYSLPSDALAGVP